MVLAPLAWLYCISAYFIGAIPFGYLIAKKLKGIDIREHGSGNVGATNVKRVVGAKAGIATMALDGLKGFLPTLGALLLFSNETDPYGLAPILTAIATIVGHSRSIFIGFSGGKSVMTSTGCFLALAPMATLITGVVVFALIKITRYVSVGSMTGALLMPLLIWMMGGPLNHILFTGIVALYVIYLHRGNIVRLMNRQENTI